MAARPGVPLRDSIDEVGVPDRAVQPASTTGSGRCLLATASKARSPYLLVRERGWQRTIMGSVDSMWHRCSSLQRLDTGAVQAPDKAATAAPADAAARV